MPDFFNKMYLAYFLYISNNSINMNSFYPAESVQLVYSGNDYFNILEKIIDEAKHTIQIHTYIFEKDATGINVLAALKRAVKRNVKVFFLADAYGSKALSGKDIRNINEDGISFRLFSPLFSSESIYLDRRLHHKIVVTDKHTALVGGINIADKYHGTSTEKPWLDYAVLIKGNICEQLHILCEDIYNKKKSIRPVFMPASEQDQKMIRFSRNDWVKGKSEIHKSYLAAVNSSTESLIFIASYFLPGYRFRKALKNARKRGVAVTVILAGKSDMPLLYHAEKYLYPFFLQHNIRILEWKDSIMHAKAVLADNQWTTIGSYNLNPVSQYLSIELNVEIKDKDFSAEFHDHVTKILDHACSEITIEHHKKSNTPLARIRNSIMYHFFKFIFLLFISKKK
jgi:cardiolipin synthase A/B